MSISEQGRGMTDTDQSHVKPVMEVERNTNESTLRTITDQRSHDIEERKQIKSEEATIQPANAPPCLPQGKSAEMVKDGDAEAPESERARVERMGRERPTQFKSFAAELAFCYSVIASQFMSVSSVAATALIVHCT